MGRLILVSVLKGLFINLFSVRLQFAIGSFRLLKKKPQHELDIDVKDTFIKVNIQIRTFSYLEDFDLAAGRVDVLQVFPVFIAGESVHLDTEGHSLLAAMLSRGELSTDAVDLRRQRGFENSYVCSACVSGSPPSRPESVCT